MQIDRKLALQILQKEVEAAKTRGGSAVWRKRIEHLDKACGGSNLTFFAALGTAMLAKATDTNVDVFSLKSSTSDRGYSARSLCQYVLAAYAPRYGIDLGVTGREPLNNSPFYRESIISEKLVVKSSQKAALIALVNCLKELDKIKTSRAAKNALRTFLSVRRHADQSWSLDADVASTFFLRQFAEALTAFVAKKSENGKRAQAAAAGILEAAFGPERVETGRINDPDARFVGDIALYANGDRKRVQHSFEVRDKKVNDADLNHFTVRLAKNELTTGAVICPLNNEIDQSLIDAIEWAEERNVILRLYLCWADLLTEVFFWSSKNIATLLSSASASILSRLQALEVSEDGLSDWVELFTDD